MTDAQKKLKARWGLYVLFNGEYGLYQTFRTAQSATNWAKTHLSWKWKVKRL